MRRAIILVVMQRPRALGALTLGLALMVVVAVLAGAHSRPADAALPGANGEIAYRSVDGNAEDIFTIPNGGGARKNVTNNPGFDDQPAWSPDGKTIAHAGTVISTGTQQIFTSPAAGGARTRITLHANTVRPNSPTWSPDGERIAFAGDDGNDPEIFTINAFGPIETPARVTNNALTDDAPDWQRLNTPPKFSDLRPRPNSTIRTSSPTIGAKITDEQTNLAKADIKLFLNGTPKTTFSYDRTTDRLSFRARNLAANREHSVRIEATDGAGERSGVRWSFTVRP